ncbi:MAG: glycerate kinase [Dehalococcoidia bacterium]|nr:glycerate kinase [Dehalococcoidia bacterium]
MLVTGEGRYDDQSARGKVTGRVLELARQYGKPAAVIAGSAKPEPGVVSVADVCGETAAFDDPAASLAAAAATLQIPPQPR